MGWRAAGRFIRPGDSPPGESVIEGDIFGILNYVLGNGCRRYKASWRYELRADMMFPVGADQHPLVIEYDGAHWHGDREEADLRKTLEILSLGHPYPQHDVIRLRQQPLRRLRPADISIPRRADAMACSRLVLLHLAHRPRPYQLDDNTMSRVHDFLAFGATQLPDDKILCDFCLELNYVLQEHYSTPRRQVRRRLQGDGDGRLLAVAAELAKHSDLSEAAWNPDDREWEQAETAACQQRGFRDWLQRQRTVQPSAVEPIEVGTTIPLLTKREAGRTEAD